MVSRRERQRRRHKQWFHQYEVEYFIRREYPGCPEVGVVYFADQVCNVPKNWTGATIDFAVNHVIQRELRHQHTDYDQLMLAGVRPSEARRRVQPKVNAMLLSWKGHPIAIPLLRTHLFEDTREAGDMAFTHGKTIRGWAVIPANEDAVWDFQGIFEVKSEAEALASKLGPNYKVVFGDNQEGTDNFIEA